MSERVIIQDCEIVNEGKTSHGNVIIENGKIESILTGPPDDIEFFESDHIIDAKGKYLLPGAIDDQVHFREPGLTEKGDIFTESRAAVAGGITTFMEMPNTQPPAVTVDLLDEKYELASNKSLANYSFYLGVTNKNLDEILKINTSKVCGIKIFMGSSTGNMLVDNTKALESIFKNAGVLIATHCEDESTITNNAARIRKEFGEYPPMSVHPVIRSAEACYLSSSLAVNLARKYNSRLHVLHISTELELSLFSNSVSLNEKRITTEVCIHHLLFTDKDYETKGSLIKWNPAVKTEFDRSALITALLEDKLDVIATDHAPHTLSEKQRGYFSCPSGGPMVQHALTVMLQLSIEGKISIEKVVEKMCHAPATCFQIHKRGYIRKGYWADLVLVDMESSWIVNKENLLYKCGWSPLEGCEFNTRVTHTFVNGNLVYEHGKVLNGTNGQRILFER